MSTTAHEPDVGDLTEPDVGLIGRTHARRVRADRWPVAANWGLADGDLVHAVFLRLRGGLWCVKLLKWAPHAAAVAIDRSPWTKTRRAASRWLNDRTLPA